MNALELWSSTRTLGAARQAVDQGFLDAALATVCGGTTAQAVERLQRLQGREDPAFHLTLVGWLESMPYRTRPQATPFWDAVLEELAARGPVDVDYPAMAHRIRGRGTGFALWLADRVAGLQVAPAPRVASAEEKEHLAHLYTKPTTPAPQVERLLEAVREAPLDRGLRYVLADRLLEEGSPRGEFLMLQLETGANFRTNSNGLVIEGPSDARQRELLEQHGKLWSGPLLAALGDLQWRDGFVHRFDVTRLGAHLKRLRGDRHLCTVQALGLPAEAFASRRGAVPELLRGPELRQVHTLGTVLPEDVKSLLTLLDRPLEQLTVFVPREARLTELGEALVGWPVDTLVLRMATQLRWSGVELGGLATRQVRVITDLTRAEGLVATFERFVGELGTATQRLELKGYDETLVFERGT